MTAEDKAKDIFVKMMEVIPDYVIPDNKVAAGVCKIHALILCDYQIEALKNAEKKLVKNGLLGYTEKVVIKKEIEEIGNVKNKIVKI